MLPTVAILGRPNVGKSTLFNRLVGRRQALVDNLPGVTRDRIEGVCEKGPVPFRLIDTAGMEVGTPEGLAGRLRQVALAGLAEADLGLFLVDARAGLTSTDQEIAALLRRQAKPILLAANKCEGRAGDAQAQEAWALGLGEPFPVSAEHGDGLVDLLHAIAARLGGTEAADGPEETAERPLRITIVGRPNAGKSTLVNRLLERERMLTGPEPGLTRDSVTIAWEWGGRRIELVDTAGLRRRARIEQRLEKLSTSAAVRALRQAEIVVLVIDATAPFERQDLVIAGLAVQHGRGLVIVLNKWDLVEEPAAVMRRARHALEEQLAEARGVACVSLSAATGRHVEKLLPAIVATHERWSKRVPTAAFNRWLQTALERHPPPLVDGRRVKLRYGTQTDSRPPRFLLFANKPAEALPDSYLRYLANGLRETFDLGGVPLRLEVRHSENPYAPG